MNIFQRIARALTQLTPIEELHAEFRMRGPRQIERHERSEKKTKRGAKHKHRTAGEGLHRRSYLPGCGPFGLGRIARA